MSWQPETPPPWGEISQANYFNLPSLFDNGQGRLWIAGFGAVQGSPVEYTTVLGPVPNDLTAIGLVSADAPVFDTDARVSGAMQIVLSGVPPGTQRILLYMRELEYTSAGQRVFSSIVANGVTLAVDLDPYQYGLDTYGQANAGFVVTDIVQVAVDGLITIDLFPSAGDSGAVCGFSIAPDQIVGTTTLYLNFFDAYTKWIPGEPYVVTSTLRTAGPNSATGDLTALNPPLLATDRVVADQAVYSAEWATGVMQVTVPNLVPMDYTVGAYFVQFNDPPEVLRDYDVDFNGQDTQYVDISNTNEIKSLKSVVTISDQGSGTGTFNLIITPRNDLATLAALSIYPYHGGAPDPTGFSIDPILDALVDVYVDQP